MLYYYHVFVLLLDNITIDNNRILWFTYNYHDVGFITSTGLTGSFTVSAGDVIPTIPLWFDPSSSVEDSALAGIACDSMNNIWIINSVENMVYMLLNHLEF